QDKNKVLLQQLADRFKVERQAFIDAMVMTGVSRQDAEKRFLDYVKNKGRG
ncbi:TPA: phage tail protein, partial [Klebsiella pneumoniae]|nr:phage tail protein [Klebsiella pneumoniae]